MSSRVTQESFTRGELSPRLDARAMLKQYSIGLKQAKNAIIHQEGGISNRMGLEYVGSAKYLNKFCRTISFIFNINQQYILEFGHKYIRFIQNGGYIYYPNNYGILYEGEYSYIQSGTNADSITYYEYELDGTSYFCKAAIDEDVILYKDDLFELDRFQNEARYVSMFSHPHIINIFNIGKYKDNFFIVYELLSGKTLKECLDERGHLSSEEAINYMLQILDATNHIHERGVIHNDLKPDNMFLFYDGNIKLLDFGIATHIGERDLEKANASILYASPEVLRSKEYSIKSDIYSLGIILYELLSGRTPYMKDNTEEEIRAHIYEEIPSLNKYIHLKNGKDFDIVIKRATNRDLNKRYKNDLEMINDLTKIKDGASLKKKSIFERIFGK